MRGLPAAKRHARRPRRDPRAPLPARRSHQVRRLHRRLAASSSRAAASRGTAEFIVFCGVHFMAESADILRAPHQKVLLPDLAAGCSMADMAAPDQLEMCWRELGEMGVRTDAIENGRAGVVPVTYINSTAAMKAFVGKHGGIVCTSTNAAGGDDVGVGARREAADASRPAPWPQHRLQDGRAARPDGRVGSGRGLGRAHAGAGRGREADPVEGASAPSTRASPSRRSTRSASSTRTGR